MIIERARQLAQRSPARVVFPDALDVRVLKAANYLHQHGLAHPVLVASPFALHQFALSHRVAMDGIQVIDPQSNQSMREEFALRWLARAYLADGQLVPRRLAGAVHQDPERILAQALAIAGGEPFADIDGRPLRLQADSLCVHGDNAESLAVLRRLRAQLDAL